jgi:hypothetical protein
MDTTSRPTRPGPLLKLGEREALEAAVARHCTCGYPRCAAHDMVRNDRRALNGLLFVRRVLRQSLLASEFSVSAA